MIKLLHKTLLTTLTLATVLLLGGCGDRAPKYRIGIAQCSSDDWRSQMNEEVERELMFHPDVEVEIRSANDDNARQIADLQYFEREGFDLIIASPNESEAVSPTLSGIYRRGTPVLVFDRRVKGNDYTTFHGADNAGIGAQAASYARSFNLPAYNVIEIEGLLDSSPAQGRHEGFNRQAKALGLNILASVSGRWRKEVAAAVADSLLRLYPQTNVIYAHNDRMAIGAAEVARKLGRDDIRVIGIDGAANIGIQAVADSVIDATFLYPTAGAHLLRAAIDILDKKPFEREVIYPLSGAIDRTNADILLLQNSQLRQETDHLRQLKHSVDRYESLHQAQQRFLIALALIALLLIGILSILLKAYYSRKRTAALLEEKNREIEEATQARLLFFTNVSHDLRTPLTLIQAPLDTLSAEAGGRLTASERQLLGVAQRNVGILRRLISDILDFRRVGAGKLHLQTETTDVAALVRACTDNFASLARARGITLECTVTVDDGASAVMAVDAEKLERVLFNLLSNSFKYVANDGHGAVTVTAHITAQGLTVTCSDNGPGIPADKLTHIFERFYQADGGKSASGGSGIGLSVAQYIIEMHGGTISAASEPGRGTAITFTLPRKTASAKTVTPTPSVQQPAVKEPAVAIQEADADAPLVLVVDDNPDVHTLVTGILGKDYRLEHALDGAQGIAMATETVPDAVICDVMMPGMDGLQCCRELKTAVVTSHIPVMMLTACADDEQRCAGLDNGADAYMSKPFSPSVLRAQLASLLANRHRVIEALGDANSKAAKPKSDDGLNPVDRKFYDEFLTHLNRHIAESDLSIDTLAQEMGLGRSQFYRKLKALTGMSPVELLSRLRLERAASMLTDQPQLTVAEVAYATGFSSPAYFTKRFREQYGATPTDYRKPKP